MQTVSAGYRQASEQAEQQPVARLLVDWQRNGTYTEIPFAGATVQRSINSDLPGEVTLISGTAAAVADIDLTGQPTDQNQHSGYLYSPYRTDSLLYGIDSEGAPARLELGLVTSGGTPEYLTQLVGRIRDLTVEVDSGEVSATAQLVDAQQDFKFVPQLDVVVGDDPVIPGSGLPQKPGLDMHWVADAVARQGGYYASPPKRASCLVSATLHGSAQPEVGALRTSFYWDSNSLSTAAPVQFAPARFALGMADQQPVVAGLPQNFAQWYFVGGGQVGQANNQSMFFQAWYYLSASHNDELSAVYDSTDLTRRIILRTDGAGHVGLQWSRDGATYVTNYPATARITGPGWYYVAWHITYGASTTTIRIRINNVTDTLTPATPTAYSGAACASLATYSTGCEALQLTAEPYSSTMFDDAFVPSAIIEPGLSELTVIPPIPAGTDGWSILQAIAKTAGGAVFLNEIGQLQVWNRRHFGSAAASTTTQRTLRATMPITRIGVQRLADRVRNVVRVGVTPYRITAPEIIWSLTDVVAIPAHGTWSQYVDVSPAQAYQVSTDTHVYPGGGPLVDGRSGYRAARRRDGSGGAITNLVMTAVPAADSIKLTITNPNSYPVWLVSPSGAGYPSTSDGLPAVVLVGRLITNLGSEPDTGDTPAAAITTVEYRDEVSISEHGERPLPALEASVWMQNVDDASDLAKDIGFEISQPRPQLSAITILADPALMLGDRVWAIDDSGLTGLDDPAWIVGITTRPSALGALQDLVLRPVAAPGSLILDEPDRGILDDGWVWG